MTTTTSEPDSGESANTALGPAFWRHLEHAPITEALVDFRVQLAEGFSIGEFEPVVARLAREYPVRGPIKDVHVKPSESAEIYRVLAALHEFKNEIFFRSITQKASELFE